MVQTRTAKAVVTIKRKQMSSIPNLREAVIDDVSTRLGINVKNVVVDFRLYKPTKTDRSTLYYKLDSRLRPTPA